jgi:dTDP-4-amino-4,6-dideoxy-D-galactose acyltransferase
VNHALPVLLDWDTKFFGFPVARLEARELDAADLATTLKWAQERGVRCIYVLREQDDAASAATLATIGSECIDERSTYTAILQADVPHPAVGLRIAQALDVPRLREIAAVAYTDARFFVDTRIDPERSAALYMTWIERSVHGGADLVLVEGPLGAPRASASVHFLPDRAQIGLVAVAPKARGQGLARALMLGLMEASIQRGLTRMDVVTQGRNLAARKLYESLGFHLTRVQCWHHLWLD